MARNQRKVQQQRQKRKVKQRSIRRAHSGSPYRQISRTGEVVACYVTQGWRERGNAAIFCLVVTPGGGHATATFLVDLWCVGLKDAWGKLGISAKGFKENILDRARNENDVELIRVDVDWVRKIVAGAIRFAEQNGFRLPNRYERWTSLLGEMPDAKTADLAGFGYEGGLHYVGTVDDLRRRLIDTTPEEFMCREDVHYTMEIESPEVDDGPAEVGAVVEALLEEYVSATRQWCFSVGREPHPLLRDAWALFFESVIGMASTAMEDEKGEERITQNGFTILADRLATAPPGTTLELRAALSQARDFTGQFESREALNAYFDANLPPQTP